MICQEAKDTKRLLMFFTSNWLSVKTSSAPNFLSFSLTSSIPALQRNDQRAQIRLLMIMISNRKGKGTKFQLVFLVQDNTIKLTHHKH